MFAGMHFPHGVFVDSMAYDKQAAELWKNKFLLYSVTSFIVICYGKSMKLSHLRSSRYLSLSMKVSVEYTAIVTTNMTLHIFFCYDNMEVKHHDIYLK